MSAQMVKRLVWSFILLLVLVAAGIIYAGAQKQSPDDTQTVTRGPIERLARGNGRIEGIGEPTPLSFGRAGRLDTIEEGVEEGKEVEMNQVLAVMNSAELDVKIAEAEAALKVAQQKFELAKMGRTPEVIKQADERLKQAAEEVTSAKIKLKFLQEPSPPPPAPAHEIAEAGRNIERAKAKLALEQTSLEKLKAGPTAKDLAVIEATVNEAEESLRGAEKLLAEFKAPGPFNSPISSKPQLEVNVDLARKRLQKAEAERDKMKQGASPHEVQAADQRVKLAQTEVESAEAAKKLLEKPPLPPPATEQSIAEAKVALLQAQARERQAEAALKDLQRGPEEAEVGAAKAAVDQAATSKKLLELYREGLKLRAPFSGRITRRHVEPGATVNAFTPIITMIDFSKKRLRTEFDVSKLAEITPGMKVALTSKAFKEPLDGIVDKIVGVGTRKIFQDDPGAPKGGEVMEVLINVEEPKGEVKKPAFALLLPGLRMDAAVTLERRDNVMRILKSFVSNDGKEYVWLKEPAPDSTKVTKRYVKCGLRDEQNVEITEGLSEGDVIVKPRPLNLK